MARCSKDCKSPSKLGMQPEDYCCGCPRLPEGLSYGTANALFHWPEDGHGSWRLIDKQLPSHLVRLSRTVANLLIKKRWAVKVLPVPRQPHIKLTAAGRAQRDRVMAERAEQLVTVSPPPAPTATPA